MKKGVVILGALILALSAAAYAQPGGAQVTEGTDETWGGFTPGNVIAQGGNITPVNLTGMSQTLAWQGFYGEITGNITLRDNSGDQMYSWSLIVLNGTVFASQDNAVAWATIAGQEDCTTDEALTGTNSDRTNRTFTNASLTNWVIGGITIPSACRTYTYVNNASQSTSFEEIILTDGADSVYGTKIYVDTTGFDAATHDYQMIVPDNITTATTTYYFYAEFL